MMTKEQQQSYFNTAVAGLASQGFTRSTAEGSVICRYRGDNGKKCAIGWLLPDEKYDAHMDVDCGLALPMKAIGLEIGGHSDFATKFLSDLQYAHDQARDVAGNDLPDRMKASLIEFATDYALEPPEVLR